MPDRKKIFSTSYGNEKPSTVSFQPTFRAFSAALWLIFVALAGTTYTPAQSSLTAAKEFTRESSDGTLQDGFFTTGSPNPRVWSILGDGSAVAQLAGTLQVTAGGTENGILSQSSFTFSSGSSAETTLLDAPAKGSAIFSLTSLDANTYVTFAARKLANGAMSVETWQRNLGSFSLAPVATVLQGPVKLRFAFREGMLLLDANTGAEWQNLYSIRLTMASAAPQLFLKLAAISNLSPSIIANTELPFVLRESRPRRDEAPFFMRRVGYRVVAGSPIVGEQATYDDVEVVIL